MTSGNGKRTSKESAPRARVIWAPIPDFPGYEASTDGQVRSLDRTVLDRWGNPRPVRGMVLAQMNKDGYRTVNIQRRPRTVHSLVLAAFVGPRPDGACVRHLNDIRHDNRLANLTYGTARDNSQDALRNSRYQHQDRFTCPKGHPYTTTEKNDRGYTIRRCKQCRNQGTAARQKRAVESTVGVFEAARILERPVAEVKAMMDRGELKTRKVSHYRRILRSELPSPE